MRIDDLVQDAPVRLTKADFALLDILQNNPEAVFLSANEIAQRAKVNPASAVRFARKLGFEGYTHFRAALQADLVQDAGAAHRVRKRIERLSDGDVVRGFVDSEIRALDRLPEQISILRLGQVAEALVRAARIQLYGTGHAEVLARLLEIRLLRGGYPAELLDGDARQLASKITRLERGDVLIVFAMNALHPNAAALLAIAKRTGCFTCAVTDQAEMHVEPKPDVILAADRGEAGDARSLTVPMAIGNLLILEVSRRDQGKMINHLEVVEEMARKFRVV